MLKRWYALPGQLRWLLGSVVVIAAAAGMAWALFVPAADWIAHHDVGSVTGSLRETALDNARDRLLTLGAGLFAAGALWFTARNFTLSRRTYQLTEQRQVTDRYTRAIEQLGSDKLDIRIGGIYALERIAFDSSRDHPTVFAVLSAFIREHSREEFPEPSTAEDPRVAGEVRGVPIPPSARKPRPDVQAAASVIGRRDATRDQQRIDLTNANLDGVDLPGADLSRVILDATRLTGARLTHANLANASLVQASLPDARLEDADLQGADLSGANLTGANLMRANLAGAALRGAQLSGVLFGQANLTGVDLRAAHLTPHPSSPIKKASLWGADLTDADFRTADLRGASFEDANLTGTKFGLANLTGVSWPQGLPIPEGWEVDKTGWGLRRVLSTDPED